MQYNILWFARGGEMAKNIMIIEHNERTRKTLSRIAREQAPNACVEEYATMDGVYEAALNGNVSLFVVDIVMNEDVPGDTSGIRFIDSIRQVPRYEFTPVIFIAALEDPKLYAYSALNSLSYIEKPFDRSYLAEAVKKAMRFPEPAKKERIMYFRNDGVLFPVRCSELLYAESIDHRMHIYKTDGTRFSVTGHTCKRILCEYADDCLVQCSRSAIINTNYIENIDMSNKCIKMKGSDEPVVIGFTYKKMLKEIFAGT